MNATEKANRAKKLKADFDALEKRMEALQRQIDNLIAIEKPKPYPKQRRIP